MTRPTLRPSASTTWPRWAATSSRSRRPSRMVARTVEELGLDPLPPVTPSEQHAEGLLKGGPVVGRCVVKVLGTGHFSIEDEVADRDARRIHACSDKNTARAARREHARLRARREREIERIDGAADLPMLVRARLDPSHSTQWSPARRRQAERDTASTRAAVVSTTTTATTTGWRRNDPANTSTCGAPRVAEGSTSLRPRSSRAEPTANHESRPSPRAVAGAITSSSSASPASTNSSQRCRLRRLPDPCAVQPVGRRHPNIVRPPDGG